MRIEDLVDKVLETDGLLNWERHFCRLKLGELSKDSLFSAHYFIEFILLLPSVLVFLVSLYLAPSAIAQEFRVDAFQAYAITWTGYPIVVFGLLWVLAGGRKKETMELARQESVRKTFDSIERHIMRRSQQQTMPAPECDKSDNMAGQREEGRGPNANER